MAGVPHFTVVQRALAIGLKITVINIPPPVPPLADRRKAGRHLSRFDTLHPWLRERLLLSWLTIQNGM